MFKIYLSLERGSLSPKLFSGLEILSSFLTIDGSILVFAYKKVRRETDCPKKELCVENFLLQDFIKTKQKVTWFLGQLSSEQSSLNLLQHLDKPVGSAVTPCNLQAPLLAPHSYPIAFPWWISALSIDCLSGKPKTEYILSHGTSLIKVRQQESCSKKSLGRHLTATRSTFYRVVLD